MVIEWKVGDRVEWEHFEYKRRVTIISLKQGTIISIDGGCALIDKGKWQRRETVYLSRLRHYADTTMPEHQP